MARPRRIYWDTSCFICFLNRREIERRAICEDVLRHAQAGQIELHTSVWTIAEVVGPKRKSLPTATRLTAPQIAAVESMFRWSWVKKLDVEQRVAFKAVQLSRDFGLSPSDAIHAATAIVWQLDALQKWDRDFSRIGHLITVEEPVRLSAPGAQTPLAGPGFDPPRLGPHPDDFEEPGTGA